MREKLRDLCLAERSNLLRLAMDIANCAESMKLVAEEAMMAAKRELTSLNLKGEPSDTIQVTPLQDSSKLLSCISEFNARMLWRGAVKRIIDDK